MTKSTNKNVEYILRKRGKQNMRLKIKKMVAGILLFGITLSLPVSALPSFADSPNDSKTEDWMKTIPDEMPLSTVTIPGTHDSASEYILAQSQILWDKGFLT